MAKYKVLFNDELEDEVFDTEEEAEEHALYLASCTQLGAEILHMSNPGDYDEDDYEADSRTFDGDGYRLHAENTGPHQGFWGWNIVGSVPGWNGD